MSQIFDPLRSPLQGAFLVEASAGTGKTYTLTLLYLRLLLGKWVKDADADLPQRDVTEILVVTFTQAATLELRERIRRRIYAFCDALQKGDMQQADVVTLLGESTQRYSSEILACLLKAGQRMDEAAIFTIHGFCQRMLARFRFETGQLQMPQLLDDDRPLKKQAVEDYWREHVYDASDAEINFIGSFFKDPHKLYSKIHQWIQRPCPSSLPKVDNLCQWLLVYQQKVDKLKKRWLLSKEKLYRAVVDQVQRYTATMVQEKFVKIDDWVSGNIIELDTQTIKALSYFSAQQLAGKKLKKEGKPPKTLLSHQIDDFLQLHQQGKSVFFAHAIKHCHQRFLRLKKMYNQQGFDDLLTNLDQALQQDRQGQLAQQIITLYPCALIDEFQDTDAVQYRIFQEIYLTRQHDGCLFFIGDPKQAIYSFRGADVFTYMQAREQINTRYTLDTNWRSTPELIQAVNALFADRGTQSSFLFDAIAFVPVHAGRCAQQSGLRLQGNSLAPLTFWQAQSTKAQDIRLELANACAFEIHKLLLAGQAQQALIKGQRVKASDIAVLVRDRREAEAIEQALARRGIPSAYLSSGESVFTSTLAQDLYTLLTGVVHVHDSTKLRAALATSLMGYSFAQLAHLREDENAWEQEVSQFHTYLKLWRRYGVLAMLRRLLFEHHLAPKLQTYPDGSRQLTDLLHLGELLQQTQSRLDGEHALLRWFFEQLENPNHQAKNQQRRLDSDQHLVQIVTIHKSKGLEYHLVFLPFSCMPTQQQAQKNDLWCYHQDFEPQISLTLTDQVLLECLAEDIRLLYVAVTRAIDKLWVGVSVTSKNKINPLASLLGIEPDCWCLEQVAEKMQQLVKSHAGIEYLPAPSPAPLQELSFTQVQQQLRAKQLTHGIDDQWRVTSYTELLRQQTRHIYESPVHGTPWSQQEPIQAQTIFTFPKGPIAGQFLHHLFETLDFNCSDIDYLVQHVQQSLLTSPFDVHWQDVLVKQVYKVLNTPLVDGIKLSQVQTKNMQVEAEFVYQLGQIKLSALDACMRHFDPLTAQAPEFADQNLQGLMRGFIDVVFLWQGRYYILDYKSNDLGQTPADYEKSNLEAAMLAHRYDLQYQLYAVALHRLLSWRLPQYCPDTHFGGVIYLFLRGLDAKGRGIYFFRPSSAFLQALDTLFTEKKVKKRHA